MEDLWQTFNPGNTTFRASTQGGSNFAIGGATTGSENNLEVGTIPGPPLNGLYANKGNAWQLNNFGTSTIFDPNTSLFTLWLYPNDIFYFNNSPLLSAGTSNGANGTPTTFNAIPALAVDNIIGSIQELATRGANPPQPRSAGSLGSSTTRSRKPSLHSPAPIPNLTSRSSVLINRSMPSLPIPAPMESPM